MSLVSLGMLREGSPPPPSPPGRRSAERGGKWQVHVGANPASQGYLGS